MNKLVSKQLCIETTGITGSGKGVNFFLTKTLTKVDSAGSSTLLTGTGFLYINGTSGYTDSENK